MTASAAAKTTAKTTVATKTRAYKVPRGYAVTWQHGGHDLLARTTAKEGPAWYTACNEHGDLREAKTAREAEQVGALAQRSTWCTGDHKPAAKKAPAKRAAPAKK